MKLLAFDVDGTVLDTLDSIIHHVNESLHENGFYRVDDREYFKKILGYGSKYLIEKALIFPYNHIYDKNLTDEILEYYMKRYEKEPSYLTKPYPGMKELLVKLKEEGYILVAYSNKPHDVLIKVMSDIFEEGLFDEIEGIKSGAPTKPDPTVLNDIIEKYGVTKEEACYIGDSDVDMATAKNAGVHAIAVTWGFRTREQLEELKPEFIVDNAEELKEVIDRLKD